MAVKPNRRAWYLVSLWRSSVRLSRRKKLHTANASIANVKMRIACASPKNHLIA